MRRLVVGALFAVACSSNATQLTAPPPQRHGHAPPPLVLAACPKPEAEPRPTRPAPRYRAPGLFGTAGLQPRETPDRGATCQAARTTLDATDAAILRAAKATPTAAGKAWDRKTDPARWSRIAQRFALDERHRANLARDGFAVAESATYYSYVEAYHEVFQSQLPIYVSIDSILHAIYASHNGVIGDVETQV